MRYESGSRAKSGDPRERGKRGLKAQLGREVVAEVDRLISGDAVDDLDFEAFERATRSIALRVAAIAVESRLNADLSDDAGHTVPCTCGEQARYAGRRWRTLSTVLGEIRLERAYDHCARCQAGFCPRDRALGLDGGALSPALLRMAGIVGAMVSFAEGSALLHELAGVEVAEKEVERHAEKLGEEAAAFERMSASDEGRTVPQTLYLGMDGTGLPMRNKEVAGRAGKQDDGSSTTREAKICVVWSAEARDKEGRAERDEGSLTYAAAIESVQTRDTASELAPFAQRVEREAARRGFDRADRQVVMGDGALWIWNLCAELFPSAIQIVDRYHAKEHLSDVGKAIYGATSELGKLWTRQRWDELDSGTIDLVLAALRAHASSNEEARTCVGYIETNRARMDYPRFESMGLSTGSGVVEAGCKTVAAIRLKRAGMHWTVRGANAILALRCLRLSNRWEHFWHWRAAG